jgi:hypothetical protein
VWAVLVPEALAYATIVTPVALTGLFESLPEQRSPRWSSRP